MYNEKKTDEEFFSNYDWGVPTTKPSKKKNIFRKILEGVGVGSFLVGGGIISILFFILNFLFTAFIGLSMIRIAIIMFMEGSILWGSLLLIGTPLAIAISSSLFFYLIILGIFSAILWGIAHIFGFSVSLGNAWSIILSILKMLIFGGIAFSGIVEFIKAIKEKRISEFFKEYWVGILFFCFLFWLFFL
jgi:hypothetical protein